MVFESLPGVKVISHADEKTFIVGDFFAVYFKDVEVPRIYSWSEVKSISENQTDFVIHAGRSTYKIPKVCFPDARILLNLRGVLESAVSQYPAIEYSHMKRILPPKHIYKSGDMSEAPYKATGIYKEREINFSNVILLNTRLGRTFKVVCCLTIIAIFIFLHFSYGETEKNWFYFLPVSFFSGGISVMLIYLVCALIANFHYAYLFKNDPALTEEITFMVSEMGFSAVESHLHIGYEYIPWEEATYFIETNYVFIVYKNNKAVFWLPKRLFEKSVQTEISKYIAARLQQR